MTANPVFQQPAEAERRASLALRDADSQRFEISESGPRGVKAFSDPHSKTAPVQVDL